MSDLKDRQLRLAKHLRDLLQRTPALTGPVMEGFRKDAAPPPHADLVRETTKHIEVLEGGTLDAKATLQTEAIVRPRLRPVLDIVNSTFGPVPAYFPELAQGRTAIEGAIPSIGRVDVVGVPGLQSSGVTISLPSRPIEVRGVEQRRVSHPA